MRVLLVGGSGQLGAEICRRWTGASIVAPPHGELDLEDAQGLAAALDRERPDILVNCAAFHNVDRCEEQPDRAFAVNALAVDRAARLARERGAVFLTISTDYVFDGSATSPYPESACPHPISAYGASKLAGELLVDRLDARAFVVRTCGIYGRRPSSTKGYTFVDRVITQASSGEPLRIVSDVIASPTYAGDLADALYRLVQTQAYGLYHAANAGPVSWYDFACEALRLAGVQAQVEAISAGEWKAAAKRPRFSALENEKLRVLGIAMPDWRTALASYVAARTSDAAGNA